MGVLDSRFVIFVFVLPLEYHEWSAAPTSACSRKMPRGYCRSEYCTGGESMATPRVNLLSLHTPINAEHEAVQVR